MTIDNTITFFTKASSARIHYHSCFQLVVSLDETFDSVVDGELIQGLKGFLVNQYIPHYYPPCKATVMVCFINADTTLGIKLKAILGNKKYMNIDEIQTMEIASKFLPDRFDLPLNILKEKSDYFLEALLDCKNSTVNHEEDARIEIAKQYIEQNLSNELSIAVIAKLINLSPDRTRHYFSEKTGIAFSQYVLWYRIQQTLFDTIYKDITLSNSCLRNGFTDMPHFNKIFLRMFGMPPAALLHASVFVSIPDITLKHKKIMLSAEQVLQLSFPQQN